MKTPRLNVHTLAAPAAVPVAFMASVTISIGSVRATPGSEVAVPIQATNCKVMGGLQFELNYDQGVLEPLETDTVRAGAALSGAMIDSDVLEPGALAVKMISGQALSDDGELLTVHFRVTGDLGQSSALELNHVRAFEHENILEMLVLPSNGSLEVGGVADSPTALLIAAGIGALFIGLLVVLRRRRSAAA